jgi:hypothetical protein
LLETDSKSPEPRAHVGSSPTSGIRKNKGLANFKMLTLFFGERMAKDLAIFLSPNKKNFQNKTALPVYLTLIHKKNLLAFNL